MIIKCIMSVVNYDCFTNECINHNQIFIKLCLTFFAAIQMVVIPEESILNVTNGHSIRVADGTLYPCDLC